MSRFTRCFHTAFALLLGAWLLNAPALAAVQPEESAWRMPRDVSVEGHRIDWLIDITTLFVTILFVIMCYLMAVAFFKHTDGYEAHYDHGDGKKQVTFALTVSAVIFLWIDGNLFYFSLKDLDEVFWNYDDAQAHEGAVLIEINAHQWAWDARYAGPDGEFNTADDIVTLNDIRVPVNRPVILQLAATDVIHAFYLPNLRIKQDAVPGMINPMWFQAKETGEFDIACAQHCGAHHYLMKGLLTILEDDAYEAWAAEASRRSALAYDDSNSELQWGWDWKEI
jgi:cytochrome c oxidase subunit 2